MINLHDFVKDLRLSKVFTTKQCIVIENLLIYFKDLKIYKVIISINPNQLKKAKKLGISSQYKTIIFDDIPIKITDVKNVDKGNYIAIYNLNTLECSIYPGEESEEKQIQRIKEKKKGMK